MIYHFLGHSIIQHETVECLGCQLDSKLSGKAMASKVLKKINAKLKFLLRQSRYQTPAYRRLLCNTLVQWHFDYGCSSRFPLLKKSLKVKLQKAQNKCIYFCLNLPLRSHIDPSHFSNRVSNRAEFYIANTVFKYWNGIVLGYIHEMFKPSLYRCIAQDHRWYWTYLCGKQIQGKKA